LLPFSAQIDRNATARRLSERLRNTVATASPNLQAIFEQKAISRAGGGEGWSRKRELGHLIDSATNNRVRFVVAALNGDYSGTSYDGVGWVELGGYAETPWADLVENWKRLNDALVRVVERIPENRFGASCRIGGADPVSLEFLIDDYVVHMQHHLDHILG
jgi:hypothetical protein